MTQPLQPFAEALGKKIGMSLEVSPSGALFLSLGEQSMLIQTIDDGKNVLFYTEVGQPTTFRRGDVFGDLLSGNLFLAETRGATLSYDKYKGMVGLNLLLPLEGLEGDAFANTVDNMILAAAKWREELARFNKEAEDKFNQAQAIEAEGLEADEETPAASGGDLAAAYMLRV